MDTFKTLVAEMRTEQKAFFRTKNQSHLIKSKELEKQVDDYLIKEKSPQIQIFEDETEFGGKRSMPGTYPPSPDSDLSKDKISCVLFNNPQLQERHTDTRRDTGIRINMQEIMKSGEPISNFTITLFEKTRLKIISKRMQTVISLKDYKLAEFQELLVNKGNYQFYGTQKDLDFIINRFKEMQEGAKNA